MMLPSDVENEVCKKWKNLCQIHNLTKKYTILAEEYSVNMKTYLQPIKEQKDAYEHITRAYERLYTPTDLVAEDYKYIIKNLDKAISHEFRAFYDTMDYIAIVIRSIYSDELQYFSYSQIVSVYPEYEGIKHDILNLPESIALQRTKKDIGLDDSTKMAKDYCLIIDKLFEIYKNLVENVLKKIEPL